MILQWYSLQTWQAVGNSFFIVDPGNGQVLMKKEVTWYDDEHKMKYGEGKDDKYGHDCKMMKDKE